MSSQKYRHRFTLAEVLISIASIRIISAIMLQLANKYKPDSIKVMYLKSNDSIMKAISFIANSPKLYPLTDGTSNTVYEYSIFFPRRRQQICL